MKKTALILALALSGAALAGTDKDTGEVCQGSTCNGGGYSGSPVSVVVDNASRSVSRAVSHATAGAAAVNSTEVNVGSGGGGASSLRDYTPSVSAPSIDPTTPCAIPLTGSGNGPAIGVSFGTAYIDVKCEEREVIRIGLQSGNASAEAKATALLNHQLDEALERYEESETAASGSRDTQPSVWELTDY